ncbi:N(5)-(carboxyethyl)ornithine synthase [Vagococcus fluvialis]|uniref:N(5)-(carboxyethyl)ornithine synthase n=1 Tax=Vagococcus fluvialis TaxID=2738 RepID=UPI003B223801
MKEIGFPISRKENEYRRAILPEDIKKIKNPENLYLETGYGEVLGYKDEDYIKYGAHIVSREEVLQKDIICDPKIGDADYLELLNPGQTIFGWVHAVQNKDVTDILLNKKITAFAWEDMYEYGRHTFWRNNELAGEAAVLHAYQLLGKMPYNTKAIIIGRGNTARGAYRVLSNLGADVEQIGRNEEEYLRKNIGEYDVVVNCVLWDTNRNDHIIYRDDLKKMKRDSMIIDVSCDKHGGIETSIPTTFEEPVYIVENVHHYVVDHTPSLYYKTFSEDNSKVICQYLNELIFENYSKTLQNSLIVNEGVIIDKRISIFQNR